MRIDFRSVASFGMTLVAASAYVVGFAAGIVVKVAEHVGRAQDDSTDLSRVRSSACGAKAHGDRLCWGLLMNEQSIREDMVAETIRLIFHAGLHRERRAEIAFTHMALRTDDQIMQCDDIPVAEVPAAWWRRVA